MGEEMEVKMTESKVKHLEMIQAIISRMASNSVMLKGWTITLVVALFVLAGKDLELSLPFVTMVALPVLVFWGLDSYYLQKERLYRDLYDVVRIKQQDIDFSLHTEEADFPGYIKCVLRAVEVGFYLPLLVMAILAVVLISL